MTGLFEKLQRTSYLSGSNAAFIEDLYERYLRDPETVSSEWRHYFQGMEAGDPTARKDIPHGPIREEFARRMRANGRARVAAAPGMTPEAAEKQAAVLRLINAYRVRGHQHAATDPLQLREPVDVPDLDLEFHSLTEADLDQEFNTGSLFVGERMKLREIIDVVRTVYSGNIGSEYMHITDTAEKRWIQERLERPRARPDFSAAQKKLILDRLTAGEGVEK